MIDRDEREPPRERQALRRRQPDEQSPDEPRPLGDGHTGDIAHRCAGLPERLPDDGKEQLEMTPGGHLRDDPAVAGMEVRLRGHDVGADLTFLGDECGGRLVARGLEGEDHGAGQALADSGIGSFHMISASSRLSV